MKHIKKSVNEFTTTNVTDEMLLAALTELGVIEQAELERCFTESKESHIALEEVLYKNDLIDVVSLGRIIGDLMKLPYVNLSEVVIPLDVLHIIPEKVAAKQSILAFQRTENELSIATSRSDVKQIQAFLAKKTSLPVTLYYSPAFVLRDSLFRYQESISKAFQDLIQESVQEIHSKASPEPPIIKIVDTIIDYAYNNLASDIHIEPLDEQVLVRFRIDGVLHDIIRLPVELDPQIITRVKVMASLRTDEHQAAQDGKIVFQTEDGDLDIRVSIAPMTRGEKIVMRLLSERSRQFSLEDLGFSEEDLEKVQAAYRKPHGLLLATGPTGSGKTTTLYALLKLMNTRDINIMTIEDPVEYQMENVNQIQVNPKTDLTFAKGLRSIVRQDPDVILVGEIRDDETADIAINSAMTGHLVLSSLHTNNAVMALIRLVDLQVEPYLVASTVNLIIAQRLVRKICAKCRVSHELTVSDVDPQFASYFGTDKKIQAYRGKGCSVCNQTGYAGRVGIFEVLEINEEVNSAIVSKMDVDEIRKIALKHGMKSMMSDGLDKVKQGITTLEELLRVTAD